MKKYTKNINQERRQQVLDYIHDNYSLSSLLVDLGVWDETTTVIKCPFHPDSRPSFNIDADNNRYKCFSCGNGGGYMSFYYKYHTDVLEETKYFNDYVEELLSSDTEMQEQLGYSTIFVKLENVISLKEIVEYQYKTPNLINVDIRTLDTIRRKVSKEGVDILMDFFADVERGASFQELWSRYYLGNHSEDIKLTLQNKESIMEEFASLLDEVENDNDRYLDFLNESINDIPLMNSQGDISDVSDETNLFE